VHEYANPPQVRAIRMKLKMANDTSGPGGVGRGPAN
jgi:hypothetical protein